MLKLELQYFIHLTSTELGPVLATREAGQQHGVVTAKPMTPRNATVRGIP